PLPGRQGRGRVQADHALVPGAGQRGRGAAADRLPQGAPARADAVAHRKRRAAPAAVRPGKTEGKATMSTVTTEGPAAPPEPQPAGKPVNYLNVDFGVRSWLLSTDHKRIAILYLIAVTVFFFVGGAAVTVVRLQLMTPNNELVDADTYNKLFTMHGIVMIFFF